MSLSLNYPTISPSLLLDFANSGRLDPQVTFTRASNATYFDETGILRTAAIDAPRFDYNPATLAAQGLLIEESRTNLLTYSEAFNTIASWTLTDASISADATTSPSGTTTADKFIEGSGTGVHAITQGAVTSGVTYTFSVFAKAAERDQIQLSGMGAESQGFFTNYNLSTGVVTGGTTGSTMIPVGSGWYRCTLPITASATGGPIIRIRDASGNNNYTGDGTSGVYIWGAQLEAGAFPTSYIPTTTTALTRSADVASVNTLSPWFNASAGTIYAEYSRLANVSGRIVTFHDTTSGNQIRINGTVSINIRPDWQIVDGGVSQANVIGTAEVAPNAVGKTAGAYATNDFQKATNTSLGVADTSGTVPTVTRMQLGANEAGTANINGYLRRITYYPVRLSNAQLQAITA